MLSGIVVWGGVGLLLDRWWGTEPFLLLFFLYAVVERLPLLPSLLAAGGTTGALYVIFRTWLGVPLP